MPLYPKRNDLKIRKPSNSSHPRRKLEIPAKHPPKPNNDNFLSNPQRQHINLQRNLSYHDSLTKMLIKISLSYLFLIMVRVITP